VKLRFALLFVLVATTVAQAHPGHGDPVHHVIGIDWPMAAVLLLGGLVTVFAARNLIVRALGGIAVCAGVVLAVSLV
jgi:hypothetical protein